MAIFPGWQPRDADEAEKEIARIDRQMARLSLALRAAVADPDRHLVLMDDANELLERRFLLLRSASV